MRDGRAPIRKSSAGIAGGQAKTMAIRPIPPMPTGSGDIFPPIQSRRHLIDFASPRPRIGQAPQRFAP
jgi:hypothetical protein